jgi:hypothetical protein
MFGDIRKESSNDIFRLKELAERDEEEEAENPVRLPTMEEARSFAVETIDYPAPLGLQYVPLLVVSRQ